MVVNESEEHRIFAEVFVQLVIDIFHGIDVGGLANLDYLQLSEMVFTDSLLLLTVLIQLIILLVVLTKLLQRLLLALGTLLAEYRMKQNNNFKKCSRRQKYNN